MGDMADWVNDNGMIEDVLYGYEGTLKCKYCGKEGLSWYNLGSRGKPNWRLQEEDGTIHECENYKAGDKLR